MEDSSKNIVLETIHALCLIIKGLDYDKTRLSKETHELIDKFENEYSEMNNNN